MSKTDQLVKELDATPKKKKRANKSFKGFVNTLVQTVADIAQFVFYATAVAGGYVLYTQGSVNMMVVGGILLIGSVYFFASKTISK